MYCNIRLANREGGEIMLTEKVDSVEVSANSKRDKIRTPLLLHMREKIDGFVTFNPLCSDSSTYMGATQGGGADYQSD